MLVVLLEDLSEFLLVLLLEVLVLERVDESLALVVLLGLLDELGDEVVHGVVEGNEVPGEDEVVVVHVLDEGLYGDSLLDLLLAHGLGYLSGVSLDSEDEAVSELLVFGSVVVVVDDHGFLSSVSSGVNHHYLSLSLELSCFLCHWFIK